MQSFYTRVTTSITSGLERILGITHFANTQKEEGYLSDDEYSESEYPSDEGDDVRIDIDPDEEDKHEPSVKLNGIYVDKLVTKSIPKQTLDKCDKVVKYASILLHTDIININACRNIKGYLVEIMKNKRETILDAFKIRDLLERALSEVSYLCTIQQIDDLLILKDSLKRILREYTVS